MSSLLSRSVSLSACTCLLAALGFVGCGGGSSSAPSFSGKTAVTVMATSAANDQLFNFPIEINSLTLTAQDGTSVPLISSPLGEEFIHLNGKMEPLVSVVIPQGTYTSASLVAGGMDPACAGPSIFNGALQSNGNPTVKVNLAQPIQVRGTAMTVVLNLDVSKSGPFSGGCPTNAGAVAFNPVFSLTAAPTQNTATSSIYGLIGIVASANSGQLSVNSMYDMNAPHPPTWNFALDSSTVIQDASGASALTAGVPVDLDAVLQPDGTLVAKRVEVLDNDPASLTATYGPLFRHEITRAGSIEGLETQYIGNVLTAGSSEYSFASASFGMSKALSNVSNLPFTATFNANNMVAGQNVFVSTHEQPVNGFPPGPPLPVSSLTLIPQTVDGKVIATGSAGTFTTYIIQLASYNLFPAITGASAQVNQLANPDMVVVYVDGSTRQLTASAVSGGNTYRFDGLIFNDNGTLRMDCDQIEDGVAQ